MFEKMANGAIAMGRTNQMISGYQDEYVADATTSWLQTLEKSLAQMKEYQVCTMSHGLDGQ